MKKGISFLALIITTVILFILLGATIVGVNNSVQNSRKSAFASDLSSLEDAINVYYIQNGELPVVLENNKFVEYIYDDGKIKKDETSINDGKDETSINIDEDKVAKFEEELVKNSDISDGENIVSNAVFYKLDLNKIDVKKTKRGTGKNGKNDIYVIAYPSLNVYYLKGVIANKEVFFSLANLSDMIKINSDNTTSTDTTEIIQSEYGLTVKREKKAWTNKLDIIVEANLEDGQGLSVSLPQKDSDNIEKNLTTSVGVNIINIKTFKNSLELTNEQINSFNMLGNKEKYIIISKTNGSSKICSIKVNLSNYDSKKPEFPSVSDNIIYSDEKENVVNFKPIDDISGIREVRYVYLEKYDENGSIVAANNDGNRTDINTITPEYMLQNGKKALVLQDGNVQMNISKDIQKIYVTLFDKAGNYQSKEIVINTDIYIGINLNKISTKLNVGYVIKFNSDINSDNFSAETSISYDGKNYSTPEELTTENKGNNLHLSKNEFENKNSDKVYIMVTLNNKANNKIEKRVKEIYLADISYKNINSVVPGIIYGENRYYKDKYGKEAILPAGFKVSSKPGEQTIDDGLVILDGNGNEFVWIPVDGTNVKYEKWNGLKNTSYTVTKEQVEDDTLPSGITSETDQITKYHGFYVARYEAGLPDEQTTSTLMKTKTFSADDNNKTDIGKAQSKPNKIVWNRINYNNAKIVSESFVSNEYVQSGLITGTQWDTMLKFLAQEVDVDTDCRAWGNYCDKYGYTINGYYRTQNEDIVYTNGEYTKSATGYLLLPTGKFGSVVSEESPKNLFDVAGNVWEWTAETVTEKGGTNTAVGNKLLRGGCYHNYGSYNVASFRLGSYAATGTDPSIGFRFVLYIK